jgi:hypothetical protein
LPFKEFLPYNYVPPKGEEDMTILPKTTLGKVSALLVALFVFFLVLSIILFWVVDSSVQRWFCPDTITITFLYGPAIILASLVTGLISIIKSKERSLLVFLGLAIPLLLEILVVFSLGG